MEVLGKSEEPSLALSDHGERKKGFERAASGTESTLDCHDEDEEDDDDGLERILGIKNVMSKLSVEEERTWDTLDSVHSSQASYQQQGNDSFDFHASSDSFANCSESDSSLDSTGIDPLQAEKAAFTSLAEEPTPRRLLLNKSSSVRLKRGPSFRGSLQLIEESSLL